MMKIAARCLFVGGAHIDRIAQGRDGFALARSNPGTLRESVGGGAFNAARAAVQLGVAASHFGVRGGDAAGEAVTAALGQAGIEDCGVVWLDRRTPSYNAILDQHGELVAAVADMDLYDSMPARGLRRRHIRERLGAASAVLVDANWPTHALEALVENLFPHVPLAAIGISPAKVARLRSVLPRLTHLFLAKAEAVALLDADPDTEPCALAHLLASRAPTLAMAVISDGARPFAVLDGQKVWRQAPALLDAVRDVTGAGDTLAATAFLTHLGGASVLEAARLGSAAAGLRITAGLEALDLPSCAKLAATFSDPEPVKDAS